MAELLATTIRTSLVSAEWTKLKLVDQDDEFVAYGWHEPLGSVPNVLANGREIYLLDGDDVDDEAVALKRYKKQVPLYRVVIPEDIQTQNTSS